LFKEEKHNAHTTTPAFKVANMLGIIGFPALSFTGEILAAQRINVMLMKSEVLAMCHPRQIL